VPAREVLCTPVGPRDDLPIAKMNPKVSSTIGSTAVWVVRGPCRLCGRQLFSVLQVVSEIDTRGWLKPRARREYRSECSDSRYDVCRARSAASKWASW